MLNEKAHDEHKFAYKNTLKTSILRDLEDHVFIIHRKLTFMCFFIFSSLKLSPLVPPALPFFMAEAL